MGMTLWPLNTTCILCCISMHQISYLIWPLPRSYFSHFKFFTRPTCCNLIFTTLGAAKVPINLQPVVFGLPAKYRGFFTHIDTLTLLENLYPRRPNRSQQTTGFFFRRWWQPWRTMVAGHTRRRSVCNPIDIFASKPGWKLHCNQKNGRNWQGCSFEILWKNSAWYLGKIPVDIKADDVWKKTHNSSQSSWGIRKVPQDFARTTMPSH